MTRHPRRRDHGPRLRGWLCGSVAVVAVLALALSGGTLCDVGPAAVTVAEAGGPSGDAPSGDGAVPARPPPNASYEVEVRPSRPGVARIDVELEYDARSRDELRRARNGSLAAEWFRGEEIVSAAMEARGESEADLEHPRRSVRTAEGPAATTITVRYRVEWTGVFDPGDERVVIGPAFADVLGRGDAFVVRVPDGSWANWTVGPGATEDISHSAHVYTWTVGEDPEPLFALRREDYRGGSDEGSPLGSGEFLTPVAALLLVAAGAIRRR